MKAGVQVVRRDVNVRGSRRASVVGVRSLERRLYASGGVHFSLFGINGGLFVDEANADNVRVRAHRDYLKGDCFCVVFCFLYAGSSVSRLYSVANEAKAKRLVDVPAVVTDRLVSAFVVDRASVAVLALECPTADTTFGRQDGPAAILGRGGLLFLLRHLACMLGGRQERLPCRPLLTVRFLCVGKGGLQWPSFFVSLFRLGRAMFTNDDVVPNFREEDDDARWGFHAVREERSGYHVANVMAEYEILLFVNVLVFFVRCRRPRITG